MSKIEGNAAVHFRFPNLSLCSKSNILKGKIGGAVREGRLNFKGRFRGVKIACQKFVMVSKVVAFSIAFFFTKIAEVMTYCIRKNFFNKDLVKQVQTDLKILPKEKLEHIENKIENKCVEKKLNQVELKDISVKGLCISSYVSSYYKYGPVVLDWAKSILDTALVKKRKLVFLARDSLAPYKVAEMVKAQYPEKYGQVEMSYVYFSRKVVDDAETRPGILSRYLQQNGIKDEDRCLFVDIGFAGTKIDSTREQLKDLHLNIKFQYLISHTEKARGFVADMTKKMDAVLFAGDNLAVSWLEDSHQGGIESPTSLLETKEGVIYPNVMVPGEKAQTCKQERPVEYMLKKYSLKGLLDYAREQIKKEAEEGVKDEKPVADPIAWRMAPENIREPFHAFLTTIVNGSRKLYFKDK